jgi:putative endonuclease
MYSVYLAKSLKNNKVYAGFTKKDPAQRVKEHNTNSNKWSRANKPLKLVYYETFICEADARRREKFFKSGVGKKLKKIIIENLGS